MTKCDDEKCERIERTTEYTKGRVGRWAKQPQLGIDVRFVELKTLTKTHPSFSSFSSFSSFQITICPNFPPHLFYISSINVFLIPFLLLRCLHPLFLPSSSSLIHAAFLQDLLPPAVESSNSMKNTSTSTKPLSVS